MTEALYQLEKGETGELYICLEGKRMVRFPAFQSERVAGFVERVEGKRGQQLAMRFLMLGVTYADCSEDARCRAGMCE